MQPSAILKGILFCILVYCAYTDVRKRKIYNYITIPGIAAGLLLNAWLYPDGGLSSAAAGAAAVLLGGAVFVLLKGIGCGDLKLLVCIASFMGLFYTLGMLFVTSVVTLLYVLVVLITKKNQTIPLALFLLVGFGLYELGFLFFAF